MAACLNHFPWRIWEIVVQCTGKEICLFGTSANIGCAIFCKTETFSRFWNGNWNVSFLRHKVFIIWIMVNKRTWSFFFEWVIAVLKHNKQRVEMLLVMQKENAVFLWDEPKEISLLFRMGSCPKSKSCVFKHVVVSLALMCSFIAQLSTFVSLLILHWEKYILFNVFIHCKMGNCFQNKLLSAELEWVVVTSKQP